MVHGGRHAAPALTMQALSAVQQSALGKCTIHAVYYQAMRFSSEPSLSLDSFLSREQSKDRESAARCIDHVVWTLTSARGYLISPAS